MGGFVCLVGKIPIGREGIFRYSYVVFAFDDPLEGAERFGQREWDGIPQWVDQFAERTSIDS